MKRVQGCGFNALGRRVIFRRYRQTKCPHTYLMLVGRIVFDWWPNDRGDRLRVLNRIVLR